MFSLLWFCIFLNISVHVLSSKCINEASTILQLSSDYLEKQSQNTSNDLPVVTMSYAQTLDGSIAPSNRTRWNLSSKISFHLLHSLRARHDGVLIGIKTLYADAPQLNIRDQLLGAEIPFAQTRPIILDSQLKILQLNPATLRISRPIVCCCFPPNHPLFILAQTKLAEIGGSVISCKLNAENRCNIKDAFRKLKKLCGIHSILVEGGAEIIQSVLSQQLCHQIVLTLKPVYFGGYRSLTHQLDSPVSLHSVVTAKVEEDVVLYGLINRNS